MRNTVVYLIRHGEIDNPQKVMYGGNIDLLLNDKGREQIRLATEKIKKEGDTITKIYSSPMQRTLASSEIIQEAFGKTVSMTIVPDLIDINIPALAGKPTTTRDVIHASGTDEYNDDFVRQGNEARKDIVKRISRVFSVIVQENEGETAAMVSHGDPIRFLIYHLQHPHENVPSMHLLAAYDYPQKGDVVKVVVDENNKLIEMKFLS